MQSQNKKYAFISGLNDMKCMEIEPEFNRVTLNSFNCKSNQIFEIRQIGNNKFCFVNSTGVAIATYKGPDRKLKCMTIKWGVPKEAEFQIIHVKKGPFAGKGFYLRTYVKHVIDVPGSRVQNGNPVQRFKFHGKSNQVWILKEVAQQGMVVQVSSLHLSMTDSTILSDNQDDQ